MILYQYTNYSGRPRVTEISPSCARWLDRPVSCELAVLLRAEFGLCPARPLGLARSGSQHSKTQCFCRVGLGASLQRAELGLPAWGVPGALRGGPEGGGPSRRVWSPNGSRALWEVPEFSRSFWTDFGPNFGWIREPQD